MLFPLKLNVEAILLGAILTSASYLIGLHAGWITEISLLEVFSVFTSYWCTYLCVVQSRWNYPIGAISVAALCLLFYQNNLLSSMALQIYLFPTLLYGWFRWREDANTRPVTFVQLKWYPAYIGLTAIVGEVCMYLNILLGGSNSFWDTSILVLSILAQFMLDNKKLENWAVWLVVDIISVCLYWNQDLKILAIQMGLFGLNALWGCYMWWKTYKSSTYSNFVEEFPTDTIRQETYK